MSQEQEAVERVAARVVQRICEFDDRTSPEDWPEAMLVTGEELTAIILEEMTPCLPPSRGIAEVADVFRITLPNNMGQAEVRHQNDGLFAVFVIDPNAYEGGYRSAWNLPSFEEAVRNIMQVIWPGCLPFDPAFILPMSAAVTDPDAEEAGVMQRAREMLAAEVSKMNRPITAGQILTGPLADYMEAAAVRAIAAALRGGLLQDSKG